VARKKKGDFVVFVFDDMPYTGEVTATTKDQIEVYVSPQFRRGGKAWRGGEEYFVMAHSAAKTVEEFAGGGTPALSTVSLLHMQGEALRKGAGVKLPLMYLAFSNETKERRLSFRDGRTTYRHAFNLKPPKSFNRKGLERIGQTLADYFQMEVRGLNAGPSRFVSRGGSAKEGYYVTFFVDVKRTNKKLKDLQKEAKKQRLPMFIAL